MSTRPLAPGQFDDWLITTAAAAGKRAYDVAHRLIRMPGSASSVHTALGGRTVHAFRESTTYALILLETGAADEAAGILDRVLDGQDLDPLSDTYGIWPYYLEEPLERMARPDTNWADFIGQELVLTMIRHAAALPSSCESVCEPQSLPQRRPSYAGTCRCPTRTSPAKAPS